MANRSQISSFGTAAMIAVGLASATLAVVMTLLVLRVLDRATSAHESGSEETSARVEDTRAEDTQAENTRDKNPRGAGRGPSKTASFHCPMHPTIVQDHPGNCPICGMKLIPVKPEHAEVRLGHDEDEGHDEHEDHGAQAKSSDHVDREGQPSSTKPSGLVTVEIDPERQQLIGLRTAEVTRGAVAGAWRTVGRIVVDETRVRHVNLKVPGFIERIYVDFIGKHVKRGDPLFSIYSPELLAAQEEFLLALKTDEALSRARGDLAAPAEGLLLSAARRKLELWDVPTSEIERIKRTGKPTKTLTFRSPVSGVVVKKDIVEGMKLDAGAMPYEIVDLTRVWVLVDIYEPQLRFVRPAMTATLELNAFPGREFHGRVDFLDPVLDPKTRTVKARLTFPNPTGELRPEMFGEVELHGTPREAVRVPIDAIIDSGMEKVVFVVLGEGKFQPRRVSLGASDGTYAEVERGLDPGEHVVTRANFLIDSESRLRASLDEFVEKLGTDETPSSRPSAPHGSHQSAPQGSQPNLRPSSQPNLRPSSQPSSRPSSQPGLRPSSQPSSP